MNIPQQNALKKEEYKFYYAIYFIVSYIFLVYKPIFMSSINFFWVFIKQNIFLY